MCNIKRESLNNPQYQDNMYSMKRETYKEISNCTLWKPSEQKTFTKPHLKHRKMTALTYPHNIQYISLLAYIQEDWVEKAFTEPLGVPKKKKTYWVTHGLINNIDTKEKRRRLKKLTRKGTLRQVFIRVYRLEIQSVMLVFLTQLCELLPFSPSFWFNSPPPFPVWISILYTRIQCVIGGGV